jgi:hypothetical protein
MDSYFAPFDVHIRDADGVEIPLANYTLTVGFEAIEIEVESDENGFVFSSLLEDIPPESEIDIFDDTGFYDGVLTQITKADALTAAIENKQHRFIIEDNYLETSETLYEDIYIQDRTDVPTEPEYIGTVRPGETLYHPYESIKGKTLRFYKVERDSENARRETDLSLADYVDFDPASSRPDDRITVDTTEVASGTNGYFIYNNNGLVGEANAERIVASYQIDLNTGSLQTAYTVPAGLNFILTKAVFRDASEDLTSGDLLGIKDRSGVNIFIQETNEFTAVGTYKPVRVGDVTPIYQAGDTVDIEVATAYGSAATLDVDIFGYVKAAPAEDILDGGITGSSFAGAVTDGGDANDSFTDIIDGGEA